MVSPESHPPISPSIPLRRGKIEPEAWKDEPLPTPSPASERSGGGRGKTGLDYIDPGHGGRDRDNFPTDQEDYDREDYARRLYWLWILRSPSGSHSLSSRNLSSEKGHLPRLNLGKFRSQHHMQIVELEKLLDPIRCTLQAKEFLHFIHEYSLVTGLLPACSYLPTSEIGFGTASSQGPYETGVNLAHWEERLLKYANYMTDTWSDGLVNIPYKTWLAFLSNWEQVFSKYRK